MNVAREQQKIRAGARFQACVLQNKSSLKKCKLHDEQEV